MGNVFNMTNGAGGGKEEIFLTTVTQDADGTYAADHTAAEIYAAFEAGKICLCNLASNNNEFSLANAVYSDHAVFTMGMDNAEKTACVRTVQIMASGDVTVETAYQAGRSIAGEEVSPTQDTTVTAGSGAEIFNDVKTRAYDAETGIVTHGNVASGSYAHAEGLHTTASGTASHAEGGFYTGVNGPQATAYSAHAEGSSTTASGSSSHAEGGRTTASGISSHAEGYGTTASGNMSHSTGYHTIASALAQVAIGKYNIDYPGDNNSPTASNNDARFIIGKGSSDTARANAFRVGDSNVYGGTYNSSGADYAEYFEWLDGNPDGEDRTGRFVTLEGEKIRLAIPGDDFVLGIVSGAPSIIGDSYDDQWQGMFLTDIFGRPVYETVKVPAEIAPDGTVTAEAYEEIRQKQNPCYDPAQKYMPRSQRPEWAAVGIMGKLVAVDDGTCQVNGWCDVGEGGTAARSEVRTRYRVMARLDETHIRVLIL